MNEDERPAAGTCGRALSTGEPCPDHPERGDRWLNYDAAIREHMGLSGLFADTSRTVSAVMAVADAEQKELRRDLIFADAEYQKLGKYLEKAEEGAELRLRNEERVIREREIFRQVWKEEQQRRAKAEATIERVRGIHHQMEAAADGYGTTGRQECACGYSWPCPTIKAVDGEQS